MTAHNTQHSKLSSIIIRLSSTEDLLALSCGEVSKAETLNYRNLSPVKCGLFAQEIFGPTENWQCECGAYKSIKYQGIKCEKCGVEVAPSKVRGERMGHIQLATPILHPWYREQVGLLLNISLRNIKNILNNSLYVVTGINEKKLSSTLDAFQNANLLSVKQRGEEANSAILSIKLMRDREIQRLKAKIDLLKKETPPLFDERCAPPSEETSLSTINEINELEAEKNRQLKALAHERAAIELAALEIAGEKIDAVIFEGFQLEQTLSDRMGLSSEKEIIFSSLNIPIAQVGDILSGFHKTLVQKAVFKGIEIANEEALKFSHSLLADIDNRKKQALAQYDARLSALYEKMGAIDKRINQANEEKTQNAETDRREAEEDALISECAKIWAKAETEMESVRNSFLEAELAIADAEKSRCASLLDELRAIRPLSVMSVIVFEEKRKKFGDLFHADTGAETLLEIVREIDLRKDAATLRAKLPNVKNGKTRARMIRHINLAETFLKSGNKPEWMFLSIIPILPPDKRKIFQLADRRIVSSDLNDLYLSLLRSNIRLKKLLELNAPDLLLRVAKRTLQIAADRLFGDIRQKPGKAKKRFTKRARFCLSDQFRGRRNKFLVKNQFATVATNKYQALPDISLKMNECGLPKTIAKELYFPYIIEHLLRTHIAANYTEAKRLAKQDSLSVFSALKKIALEKPLVLYSPGVKFPHLRMLTPKIAQQSSLTLHPVTAKSMGIAFSESKLGLFIPISVKTAQECERVFDATQSLGTAIEEIFSENASSEISAGIQRLTKTSESQNADIRGVFTSFADVEYAYATQLVKFDQKIILSADSFFDESGRRLSSPEKRLITTTVGKAMFNQLLPDHFQYINEEITLEKLADLFFEISWRCDGQSVLAAIEAIARLGLRFSSAADDSGCTPSSSSSPQPDVYQFYKAMRNASVKNRTTALMKESVSRITETLLLALNRSIIREEDCGAREGIWLERGEDEADRSFMRRIIGRVAAKDIGVENSEYHFPLKGEMIDYLNAEKIAKLKIKALYLRSPMKCKSAQGLCRKCFGADKANMELAPIGFQAGIHAALTFGKYIEARINPNDNQLSTELSAKWLVEIERFLSSSPPTMEIDALDNADAMEIDARAISEENRIESCEKRLLNEFMRLFAMPPPIDSRPFELIIQRMLSYGKISDPGDSAFFIGDEIDRIEAERMNEALIKKWKRPMRIEGKISAITDFIAKSESWIASSNQEDATPALAQAALQGMEDKLTGTIENRILGARFSIQKAPYFDERNERL